jgi:hypothetical protein
MKKFLINILYFLLPAIIMAYPLDSIMSHFLRQSDKYAGEYEVWNDIYDSKANCDIAIYGSSRAFLHISPQILSDSLGVKVYNFGIDGHNFWLQYLRHLELLKYNKKPKSIILSVDVFTLQKRKDLYQLDQFLPYMLWNSNIHEYTHSYIGYNCLDYYVPLIRYFGKTYSLTLIQRNIVNGQSNIHCRQNGFWGRDKEWNADLENAKKNQKFYEINTDSTSIELFEKFIKECKSNNIDLIFVYTPEFVEGQKFVVNRDQTIKIYKDFSIKYSIDFYDYSNDSMCLEKKYFYNSLHLNKTGAEIFTRKLAHDLKARTHNSTYPKGRVSVSTDERHFVPII